LASRSPCCGDGLELPSRWEGDKIMSNGKTNQYNFAFVMIC
jgi:hypothetical protein